MKKICLMLAGVSCLIASSSLQAKEWKGQEFAPELKGFDRVADVAEYGNANWNNLVGTAYSVSLEEAGKIAAQYPEITYFFYTKGGPMTLVDEKDYTRCTFYRGDAVFFTGTPHFGSAPGLADGYIKSKK